LFNISYEQDRYEEAREHLQKAIDAGGLNAQQIDEARYQSAQLYIQEEKWSEGAAALEEWLQTAASPNSAAYYCSPSPTTSSRTSTARWRRR
jgi:TPR repeat protein